MPPRLPIRPSASRALAVAATAVAIGCAATIQTSAQPGWTTYRTGDGGLIVDLPPMIAEGPADGITAQTARFTDATGTVGVELVSAPRPDRSIDATFADMAAQAHAEGVALDYTRKTARFAVVSGENADKVLYARCNFAARSIACINITYPTAHKRALDRIVTRISLSLRAAARLELAN